MNAYKTPGADGPVFDFARIVEKITPLILAVIVLSVVLGSCLCVAGGLDGAFGAVGITTSLSSLIVAGVDRGDVTARDSDDGDDPFVFTGHGRAVLVASLLLMSTVSITAGVLW